MTTTFNKSGKYTLPYDKMLQLWKFYDKDAPELYRGGELLINKALSAEFSFQWGIIKREDASYEETIKASLNSLLESKKKKNEKKDKKKKNGDKEQGQGTVNLYDLMQDRANQKEDQKEKEEQDKKRKKKESQQSRRARLAKSLTKLDTYTIYKNLMMKMRSPQEVASNKDVALAQYHDERKEKATGIDASNIPEGDIKNRGQVPKGMDENIVASIAAIASGEMPNKIPRKGAVVTSEETPGDLRWMEEFMREALKYKMIFGMVPYSAGVDSTGRRRLFIRDITEGEFVIYRDHNSQIKAYWQSRSDGRDGGTKAGKAYVYIWPDNKPRLNMVKAPWSSTTDRLMSDWFTLLSTKQNKLDADWLSAHVPVVTKCTEQLVGMNEMTSHDVFNRLLRKTSNPGGSEREAQKSAIDMDHARRTLTMTGLMNSQKARSYLMRNIQKHIGESGDVEEISRGMSWEHQKMPIPYGREPASITLPKSPTDYESLRRHFAELVSISLGVPLKEVSGVSSARTVKGQEGVQSMFEDAVQRARRDAQMCLEEAFTIAFGEQESSSIQKGLDQTYNAMSDEMRAISYYETIYGLGLDNPTKPEMMKRQQEAAMLDNYIYGKAFEVIQMAMDDAVTLDPATVRQHIKDMITVHQENVKTLEERAIGLWNAHYSQVRLRLQWKPTFSKELMSLLVEGYNTGFIGEEPARLYYLDAMSYPLDTPSGLEKERRMEQARADHAKELEKLKQQHEIEKIKIQAKMTREMEKLKSRLAPTQRMGDSGLNAEQSFTGKRKVSATESEEKTKMSASKKKKMQSSSSLEKSKSVTEREPVLDKEAKKSSKVSSSTSKE